MNEQARLDERRIPGTFANGANTGSPPCLFVMMFRVVARFQLSHQAGNHALPQNKCSVTEVVNTGDGTGRRECNLLRMPKIRTIDGVGCETSRVGYEPRASQIAS